MGQAYRKCPSYVTLRGPRGTKPWQSGTNSTSGYSRMRLCGRLIAVPNHSPRRPIMSRLTTKLLLGGLAALAVAGAASAAGAAPASEPTLVVRYDSAALETDAGAR